MNQLLAMKSSHSNHMLKLERKISTTLVMVSLIVLLALFFMLILRRAWLCDDAYITFRTVDNLVNGYKLTWNTIERVQAYTHPLWMLVISVFYYFSRDIYLTSIVLSLVISLAAVILIAFKLARSKITALILVLLLSLSNAFIDYSTSGLENALTHLLIVIFCIIYFGYASSWKRMLALSLVASLAGLNRLDILVFYLPMLLYSLWEKREKKVWLAAFIGQAPLILWECFSLFYYGFLFPNTAYAKLNTGIPAEELFMQGIYYLNNSFHCDPLTLITIFGGLVATALIKEKRAFPLMAGVLLYILYVIKIGGDFMSGRFFTASFLGVVIIISRMDFSKFKRGMLLTLFIVIVLIGLLAPVPVFRYQAIKNINITDEQGITNERLWYFGDFGLFSPTRTDLALSAGKSGSKARNEAKGDLYAIAVKNTGVFGFYAGPSVFVIDQYALSDPLLARLPAERVTHWRVGHYSRVIPAGYISRIYKLGRLGDENLAIYYDKLSLVTGGELFDYHRLIEIWNFNTGKYDDLINFDAYRYPDMVFIKLTDLNSRVDPAYGSFDRISFSDSGIDIDLGMKYYANNIEICLENDDDYSIEYLSEGITLAVQKQSASDEDGAIICSWMGVSSEAAVKGFNKIRIFPLNGNGEYGMGYLRFEDN